MIRRIWTFAVPPPAADLPLFLRRVEYLRLTDVALFVNGLDEKTFSVPAAREKRLSDTALGLHGLGVSPHLVSWLVPTESYLNAAALRLRALCIMLGARSLLFDAEEPWTRHPALRHRPEAAAETLLTRVWPFHAWPCLLGVSGIASLRESLRPLVRRCGYVLPQAYSVAGASSVYRPGVTQRLAHDQWSGLGKPIVMGLAAWKLNLHGGLTQTAAMHKALTASEDLGVTEVAYWSLRWMIESAERVEFVRQAGQKARDGVAQGEGATAPGFEFAAV